MSKEKEVKEKGYTGLYNITDQEKKVLEEVAKEKGFIHARSGKPNLYKLNSFIMSEFIMKECSE